LIDWQELIGRCQRKDGQCRAVNISKHCLAASPTDSISTAIDFRSGQTIYKRLASTGLGFNNNYAPVTLGPDGTAYVGVLAGLVSLRDSSAP